MSAPRLRAPAEHGEILAVPALSECGKLLDKAHQQFSSSNISILGRPLPELRELARRETLEASAQYHRDAGEPLDVSTHDRWLVAGHQPELFHPGVWFKNFALHQLAERHQATAVNLIIDTDAAKPPMLHVPVEARILRRPYDRSTSDAPYEERTVEDEQYFAEFPERVVSLTSRWDFEPMLHVFWREVMEHSKRTPLLGERFAAARRALERRMGCEQREVPMSRVCQTEAFARFGVAILERLSEFQAIYNDAVHDYRVAHGIRSRSHPVPDLARDGDWLEAPFWAWRSGSRRGRLMVRTTASAFEMRVGADTWPALPTSDPVAAWRRLEKGGYKVRSRALTTTMFARLFLADVFMHGIGGGLYDALTDRILERFFGIVAPPYMIVSATLLLPLPRYPEAARRVVELQHRLRDLLYKPERFINANGSVQSLIRAKSDWIAASVKTHPERVERFERIREINGRLLPFVVPEMEGARLELDESVRRHDKHAVATRRDYAFCLYPEEMLRAFYAACGLA